MHFPGAYFDFPKSAESDGAILSPIKFIKLFVLTVLALKL